MRRDKIYIMEIICWLAILVVGVGAYVLSNSEGVRFMLFAICLFCAAAKFENWLDEE